MVDTPEANTDEITGWILNDYVHNGNAVLQAENGPEELEAFVRTVLRDASVGDPCDVWNVKRSMTPEDLDTVDWHAVRAALIGE